MTTADSWTCFYCLQCRVVLIAINSSHIKYVNKLYKHILITCMINNCCANYAVYAIFATSVLRLLCQCGECAIFSHYFFVVTELFCFCLCLPPPFCRLINCHLCFVSCTFYFAQFLLFFFFRFYLFSCLASIVGPAWRNYLCQNNHLLPEWLLSSSSCNAVF